MKGKTKNRIWRRVVSLAMVFILLMQLVSSPLSAFAETTEGEETTTDESTVVNNSTSEVPSVDNPTLEVVSDEPTASDSSNSTDTTSEAKDYNEVVDLEEVTEETVDLQSLAVDKEGVVHYNGKPLYAGKGDEKIPAKLDNLMKEGVSQVLVPEDESSPLETAVNSVVSFIFPTMKVAKASDAAPVIKYNGQITYGSTTVGDFTIDGIQAFCLEHSKASPASNTPYGAVEPPPYNSAKIQKALYYGWGGPKNVFKDRRQGIVVTSSILSRLYSGEINGENLPGYSTLWDKVQNGKVPNKNVSLSDSNLAIKISGGKQVSESTTFNADPDNSITFSIPSNVRFVNDSTGKGKTGGSVTVKGGQRFHFEAPLNYNTTYNSGKISGSLREYQPLVSVPKATDYQVIGFGRWYKDPNQTVNFTVPFKTQQVKHTVIHIDKYTGKTVKTTTTNRTIGSSYKVCPENGLKVSGYNLVTLSKCVSGKVPNKDFTTTFYYTTYHYLTINYYDNYNGQFIKQYGRWTFEAGANYSKTVHSQFNHGKQNTLYKIVGSTTQKGKMGRGDKVINIKYDPYHDVIVKWMNKYPDYDVFKSTEDLLKVGTKFNYTQPETFKKADRIYDRLNNSTFTGTLGYADRSHTFQYVLRRDVTVNYLDNRTGKPISKPKQYTVHQGDTYQETAPKDFKKDAYIYRYVRTDGDPEKGVIGRDNIEINYYYDIPLVELGLKKLQIYTAKSSEGLPVKVELETTYNYDKNIKDMNDPKKTVTIALYQGDKKLDSKKYKAKDIPEKLDFKIKPSELKVNTNKPYTVKIEGFDKNDFDITKDADKLTTDGYTSFEGTVKFDVNSNSSHKDEKSYVVMTEVTPKTKMKKYYEKFTYKATPLEDQKSGYGVETDYTMTYTNELGSDYKLATDVAEPTSNFYAPKELQDTYLDYEIKGKNVEVPLDVDVTNKDTSKEIKRTTKFSFPHVNVEKRTGNLFTDKQVDDGDSRIKNGLRDGGNKFYSPVWAEIDEYEVSYQSNKLGANKVTFVLEDSWNIYAQMLITVDSKTKDKDEIVFMPINASNPFSWGRPDNWTESDAKWLKY